MESLDNIKAMLVFSQVVRYGSFAEAGRNLGLTRAVVSYHIKRLEKKVKTQLLVRNTRNISLTPNGERFHRHCDKIALEAQAATEELRDCKSRSLGSIHLTCPIFLGQANIVPVISEFRREFPDVDITLCLNDDVDFSDGKTDIAIQSRTLNSAEFTSQKLNIEERVIVASPELIEHLGDAIKLSELPKMNCILCGNASKEIILYDKTDRIKMHLQGSLQTNDTFSQLSLVLAGAGVAIIPKWAVQSHIQAGRLEVILPEYDIEPTSIYAVCAQHPQSPFVPKLVEYIRGKLMRLNS